MENTIQTDHNIARVVAVNKNNFLIRNQEKEILAEVTGKIAYTAESGLDFPAVGDLVRVDYFNENEFAIIHEILPRKSLLKRKTAGRKIDYQLIAANIDIAFIIQALDHDYNPKRLDRYLVMVNEGNIQAVILLSKCDLRSAEEIDAAKAEIIQMYPALVVVAFSNETGVGQEAIHHQIESGKMYCLLGSSGVGKTTLLNYLIGEDRFATGPVREKDSRGRHVTARRQLTVLDNGGMIIDTPGMRELGNIVIPTGMDKTFGDILELSHMCRFIDCTHLNEPGCAVLAAVNAGELSEAHYQSFLKLRKESEFYEMSYLEKRQRDKKFGRFCKEVMKHKRK